MASCSGTGSSNSNYKLTLTVTQSSQNINNNTSNVSWKLELSSGGGYSFSQWGSTVKVVIDGATVYDNFSQRSIGANTTITLASGSKTITHNSDGKKSISFSASYSDGSSQYFTPGNINCSGSMALSTIPRKSTATATDADIGSVSTINVSRKSNSFTHTITYSFSGLTGTIVTKSSNTNISWTVPTTFYAKLINAKQGTVTLTIETFNGNTSLGTNTFSMRARVNEELNKPNVTINAVDTGKTLKSGLVTTALTGSNKKLILGYSDVKITASASAKNSATIKSFQTVSGDNQTNSTTMTPTFQNVHSNNFTFTATDSRGISNSISTTDLTLINYTDIQTTEIIVKRIAQTSSVIRVSLKGKYFNGNFGSVSNDITLKYRYKANGKWSEYINLVLVKKDGEFSYSNESLRNDLNYQNSYDFEFVLTDKVNIYTIPLVITKGIPVFDYGEEDFRINYDLEVKRKWLGLYQVGDIFLSFNPENPSSRFGGTWQLVAKGKTLIGVDTEDADFSTVKKEGGEKTNTHNHFTSDAADLSGSLYSSTYDELPRTRITTKHRLYFNNPVDNFTSTTRENSTYDETIDILPPYITCYIWEKTA